MDMYASGGGWRVSTGGERTSGQFNPRTRNVEISLPPEEFMKKKFSSIFSKHAGRELTGDRLQRFITLIRGHEFAEGYYHRELYRAGRGRERFGSHVSPAVIKSEFEIASLLGSETLEDALTYRRVERKFAWSNLEGPPTAAAQTYHTEMGKLIDEQAQLAARLRKTEYVGKMSKLSPAGGEYFFPETYGKFPGIPRELDESWEEFMTSRGKKTIASKNILRRLPSLRRTASTIFTKKNVAIGALALLAGQTLFSGRDDAYNTIEGMSELGLAAQQRKILTEFGSGWRGQSRDGLEDADPQLRSQFRYFTRSLEKYGVKVGTGHKRLHIPKSIITEENLSQLGFVPSLVAIPEAGQESLISYRHPHNLYHIHGHGSDWIMHRDEHEASTMKIYREKHKQGRVGFFSSLINTVQGLPHVLGEGVPGLYYYMRGKFTDTLPMIERVKSEISSAYKRALLKRRAILRDQDTFSSVYSLFSGRDDAYNTIEGMQEGGLAARLRKQNTEFGSGYRGTFKKASGWISGLGKRFIDEATDKMNTLFQIIPGYGPLNAPSKLLNPLKAAELAKQSKTVEDFATALGIKDITSITRKKNKALMPAEYSWKFVKESVLGKPTFVERISIHTKMLPGELYKIAYTTYMGEELQAINFGRELLKMKPVSRAPREQLVEGAKKFKALMKDPEDLAKVSLYHEFLERSFVKNQMALGAPELEFRMAMHASPAVLVGEAGFLEAYGRKDLADFFKLLRSSDPREKQAFEIGQRLFRGENKPVVEITGMDERGIGPLLRKIRTLFGSKYNRLKGIANLLGTTEQKLYSSHAFKHALSVAEDLGELGAGSFATARLKRTAIAGPEGPEMFHFVEKRAKENLTPLYAERLNFAEEAAVMGSLSKTSFSPSVYAQTEKTLIMEYMPGKTINQMIKQKQAIPENVWEEMRRAAGEVAEIGIKNLDIHTNNIMYDPASKRVSWIDLGMAKFMPRLDASSVIHSRIQMRAKITRSKKGIREWEERELAKTSLPAERPVIQMRQEKIDPLADTELGERRILSIQLQEQQRKLAEASLNGGKNHQLRRQQDPAGQANKLSISSKGWKQFDTNLSTKKRRMEIKYGTI